MKRALTKYGFGGLDGAGILMIIILSKEVLMQDSHGIKTFDNFLARTHEYYYLIYVAYCLHVATDITFREFLIFFDRLVQRDGR